MPESAWLLLLILTGDADADAVRSTAADATAARPGAQDADAATQHPPGLL